MGKNILMPAVYVSNNMKQKRNYKHYLKNKARISLAEKTHKKFGGSSEFDPSMAQRE